MRARTPAPCRYIDAKTKDTDDGREHDAFGDRPITRGLRAGELSIVSGLVAAIRPVGVANLVSKLPLKHHKYSLRHPRRLACGWRTRRRFLPLPIAPMAGLISLLPI